MLRRAVLIAAPLALAAGSAGASGGGEKEKEVVGQYVDLAPVALPIVVKGQLANYVFAYVRIILTPQADVPRLRAKEPYFRDALVRAAHRTPFTDPTDYTVVDVAKLKAALMREAVAIAGPKNIQSVTVLSQAPKKRMGVPKPPGRGGGEIHP